MSAPKRIQRQRTKGWRMPEGSIYVGRPTRWGNPYSVIPEPHHPRWGGPRPFVVRGPSGELWPADPEVPILGRASAEAASRRRALALAVELFELGINPAASARSLPDYPLIADMERELAGHDLVCWCSLDQPCHADVLLELANGGAS